MPMRLNGMYSGLDTDSVVQELVAAKSMNVDKVKKEQISLEWKQEAWKELNKKVLKLYNGAIGNMRWESSYMKKVSKPSNSNAVSIITGENAMNGVQNMRVLNLAKTGYLTGGKLSDDEKYTALTKMSELNPEAFAEGKTGTFKVTIGEGTANEKVTDITVTGDSTISDVLTKLKEAGVNANFDAKNQRFFISAKESGKTNDFKLESVDEGGQKALETLQINHERQVKGQDAKIELNGMEFTSSTNVFEINGLTITTLEETDEEITITTDTDTDGIYNMVKNFLKEYNAIINEMDKLYNADSSKGYEPLLDDEKEAMSEEEVEKWEKKIKDSILRRDESLNSVASAMKSIMSAGVDVNGQTMFLSDFGINTLGYFDTPDNEKNAYHIDGDSDDATTSGKPDKLKSMIASDPETVTSFFTGLAQNLFDKMTELSGSTEFSSFNTFYDDKKMKKEYTDFSVKIGEMEAKLMDYEDKYYAKFAAMETALAKMQSNQNALTGLLGG